MYALVNVYYHENKLNKEEIKKIGECIHLSLIEHFNIPENDFFQMFYPINKITFYIIHIIY